VIFYQALDVCLALLVIGAAAWTIFAPKLFGAVVGYVAYGLILAIVWIRLLAPDVALTEAAIGGGATGVLLVTAGSRLRSAQALEPGDRATTGQKALAAVLCVSLSLALAGAMLSLPEAAPTLAPEAKSGLEAAGLGNPVTAVLIIYRAFDTMLEKAVLLLAVIGVWSVAPDRFWGGAPAPLGRENPDSALVFLARMIAPIGLIIGLHIFWVSADEPGGAFQAGAILAAMWIVVMMARLADPPRVSSHLLRLALVAGPAIFIAVALLGPMMGGSFLSYPPGFVKPVILFVEVFMLLTIAASIPMLIAGPPSRRNSS
jgi:multisubunit Na+/H+ antiporter MnhB subunit